MSVSKDENERADTMGTNVYNSKDTQSMHRSLNSEFLVYQLLLQRLLTEGNAEAVAVNGLLNYFKPENETDRNVMTEFDTQYKPNKAIHWYTRETCVYRILNKSLRTQNIDNLVVFGPFIRDLFAQLSQEQKPFIKKLHSSSFQVYRGQFISKDEVNRMKSGKGQLIAMNSFLSTSTNRQKAIEFATSKPPPLDTLTTILLEINVNAEVSSRPFADIKHLSAFAQEEEILFMFGCVFRIDDIVEDKQLKLWKATLTLCGKNDEDFKQFSSTLNDDLKGQNHFVSFGNYLVEMQKFDQAEEHFEKILNTKVLVDSTDLASCYHGLAQVNNKKGEYHRALTNLNLALDYLLKEPITKDHPLVSQCYNDCGSIYCHQANYPLAFSFYEKALKTKNNNEAITYSGLARVQFQMGNSRIALEYLNKCLEKQPESAYPLIGSTYSEMGKIYAAMNDKEKASKMFEKAIEFQLKVLPPGHPDLGYSYTALGLMYSELGQEEKAFENVQKAFEIQSESLPNNHPDFGESYKNFGNLHLKQNHLDEALNQFYKLLENQLKTLSWKHPSVAETYTTIGNVCWQKRDLDQALVYFHKLLDSLLARKPFGDPSLSETYKIIGDINLEKHDKDEALLHFHMLLDNELERKLLDDPSLADIYKTIAKIYFEKRYLVEALVYFNRQLDCYLQTNPINHSLVAETYTMIGQVYLAKRHFDQILVHFEKFVHSKPQANTDTIIANVHFEKRHLDQAITYFSKFLENQLRTLSKKHPLVTNTYKILANIYFEKKDFNQALIYFQQVLNNELRIKTPEDRSLANIYAILGKLHVEKGQLIEALIYYNRLLDSQLQTKSWNHSSIADTYWKIGQIYLKKSHGHQTFDSFKKLSESQSPQKSLTDTFANVERTYFERRHLDKALAYFQRLLDQQLKTHKKTVTETFTIIGNLYLEKQDFQRALSIFHRSLQIELRKQPLGDSSSANTFAIIAKIHAEIGQVDQALIHYQQSLHIYERIYPSSNSTIRKIRRRIRDILASQ